MPKERTRNGPPTSPTPDDTSPETTLEALAVVRPPKVIAVIMVGISLLLMVLAAGATAWLEADRQREGLWAGCFYHPDDRLIIDCHAWLRTETDWLHVCRALCIAAVVTTLCGLVATSAALKSADDRFKARCYWVGMILWFIGVGLELIALVMFPIKFLDDITTRKERRWQFGWAYGVGWAAAILVFAAGLILLIDRGKQEVVYRVVEVEKEGFEEEVEGGEAVEVV